jgi:hypothetical protein
MVVQLCNRAAEKIMELLGTWRTLYTLRFVPSTSFVQIVFAAGTVFLLSALQARSGQRLATQLLAHSIAQAELCIQYLSETGQTWQCANQIGGALERLLRELLKPRMETRLVDLKRGRDAVIPSPISMQAAPSRSEDSLLTEVSSTFTSPVNDYASTSSSIGDLFQQPISLNNSPTFDADNNLQFPTAPFDGSGSLHDGVGGDDFIFSDLGPGMLGGHTIPTPQFMPLGTPDPTGMDGVNFQQHSGPHQGSPNWPWSTLELSDEDMAAIEQILDQRDFTFSS